jgi:alpha-tubulin suppressor-like RCC1 family protein
LSYLLELTRCFDRLGRTTHSQLSLTPMPDFPHTVTHLALGQDHSLAVTSGGYILSWGHNRFSQLGYPIEAADNPNPIGKFDDTVQVVPKRIVGPLKKEWVVGVAAGRMSSACWTKDSLWTWGTNAGHLGYEKMGNPVQVYPRKVTAISQEVIDVALSVSTIPIICILLTISGLRYGMPAGYK